MIEGTGSQTGNCGSSSCERWGDYNAMTLDPDGCTFWYTTEYYITSGLNDSTRIGSFKLPGCVSLTNGSLTGYVRDGANPISGATVTANTNTTTTDINGSYTFDVIPTGSYVVTASADGYTSAKATVAILANQTTNQNFTLTTAPQSGCITDTTQADFQGGTATNCDLTSSPGNVSLTKVTSTLDQSNTSLSTTGQGFTTTTWQAQSFVAGSTGQLTQVDLDLFCSACSGTNPDVTVEIRNTSGGAPSSTILATTTVPGFSSGSGVWYSAVFNSPANLTSGTTYAIVTRLLTNRTTGTYAVLRSSNANAYTSGAMYTSSNSGSSWTVNSYDAGFKTYMTTGYQSAGTLVSSIKDANPAANKIPMWSSLAWNGTTPANTTLRFQVAASSSSSGPFNFVGPDGTSSTYFTSSNASLTPQFDGLRYLQWKAYLSTTNSANTPSLADATVCFNNVDRTATILSTAIVSGTYGGTATLSATLTAGGNGLAGKTVSFTLNSVSAGSATTDGSGVASVSNVSLAGISAGSYPGAVSASFAGDSLYAPSSSNNTVTVNMASQSITFNTLPDKNYGDPDFDLTATASSGLTVSYTASGQCTVTGITVHLTDVGTCTITASQAGNTNYAAASNVIQTFNILSPTAVTVGDFEAKPDSHGLQIQWVTVLELNLEGFRVYRSTRVDALPAERLLLTPSILPTQTPGGLQGATYTFSDPTAQPGTMYFYWLEAVFPSSSDFYGPLPASWRPLYLPVIQN